MADETQRILHDAYEQIKAGNRQEAARMLVQVLKTDRQNADAWWLLANATADPDKKRQALEQVLRIRPDHGAAQRALQTLTGAMPAPSAPAAPTIETPRSAPPASPPAAPRLDDDPLARPARAVEDDPFAASSPASPSLRSLLEDDPFASAPPRREAIPDPFAGARSPDPLDDPFAAPARREPIPDPFASPASPPPSRLSSVRRDRPAEDDPFGDPFASDPFATPGAAPRRPTVQPDDPFADPFATDQPFTQAATRRQVAPPRRERQGTNPVVIVLAVIGVLVLIGCGVAIFAVSQGMNILGSQIAPAISTAFNDPVMLTVMSGTFMPDSNGIIGRITEKGAIAVGQPVRARMEADGLTNHAYKLSGGEGQRVTVELTAVNNAFDTRISVLDPNGDLLESNDDIDYEADNLNSRLEVTLPRQGVYTLVVSDVGFGGGDYELVVR